MPIIVAGATVGAGIGLIIVGVMVGRVAYSFIERGEGIYATKVFRRGENGTR